MLKLDWRIFSILVTAVIVASFMTGVATTSLQAQESNERLITLLVDNISRESSQKSPPPLLPETAGPIPEPMKTGTMQVPLGELADEPVLGNPDAPLTIIEYSDFECPFCARFHSETLPQIKAEFIDTGKAKMIYKDLPLPFHNNAMAAHAAAACAEKHGVFWEYHDVLFERQRQWSSLGEDELKRTLYQYFEGVISEAEFGWCMESESISAEIAGDIAEASSYGISGTPTFLVGNEMGYVKIVGAQPYAAFQSALSGN